MKQKNSLLFFTCVVIMILSGCTEGTPVVSSQTPTSSSTSPSTIRLTATPTLNYKTVILTPDEVFSLPEIPAWSTPNSEDFCEHLPAPQVIVMPDTFSALSGRFVLCISERAFIAMDLDAGNLVGSSDKQGDIILLSDRSWTPENPYYVISSLNNAYLSDAYVIETYANHSGLNNLSYEYCESMLQNQTDFGVMGSEIGGIACVKTTRGHIALVRVEKIYPTITLSVEFSFAILRNE